MPSWEYDAHVQNEYLSVVAFNSIRWNSLIQKGERPDGKLQFIQQVQGIFIENINARTLGEHGFIENKVKGQENISYLHQWAVTVVVRIS